MVIQLLAELPMEKTSDFYTKNAQAFFDSTVSVDAEELYRHFLPHIPAGGRILDAGCGSGRDANVFLRRGFQVAAFDASEPLAALASELLGQKVSKCLFREFSSEDFFDGIWACASLLHVPLEELSETMRHLSSFLKAGGCFYCSFKYGQGEAEVGERHFTYMDEPGIEQLAKVSDLRVYQCWITPDLRPGREDEKWLNAILQPSV